MTTTPLHRKKIWPLLLVMLLSLLWLGYQVWLWGYEQGRYVNIAQKFMKFIDIPALYKDAEWKRFASVMSYLQTLPHVLCAYCLFTKWPGKKNALRVVLTAAILAVSLLVVPKVSQALFKSYKNVFSTNNPDYFKAVMVHGAVGIAGVLAAFFVNAGMAVKKKGLTLLRGGEIGVGAANILLTVAASFMIAVAYGCVLGVLNHFSPQAVGNVLKSFEPDAKLVSGIITMGVMAPLMEEMAFRGLIMQKTRKYSSDWFAVIFSAVLFGLWHRNLGQFFATTAMGVVFALIYIKSGKLRYAMLAHCLSNVFLSIAAANGKGYLPQINALVTLKKVLLGASLPVGIICLIASFIMLFVLVCLGYPIIGNTGKGENG